MEMNKNKTRLFLATRAPAEMRDAVEAIARERGWSQSTVVREAVAYYLSNPPAKPVTDSRRKVDARSSWLTN